MNSTQNVLENFEWEYDGPIGFARGKGFQGVGISRTMFLRPKLEDIPENLFAVKVSQSNNPQKAGKLAFKYLTYRLNENEKPNDLVPSGIDLTTELKDIKSMFLAKLANMPGVVFSLNIGLKGKFTSITCTDGTFKLYDEDEPAFKTDNPDTSGNAPYYVKSDAQVHVKLKGAMGKMGKPYIQSELSSTSASNEILAQTERGHIWNPNSTVAAEAPAADGMKSVW